MTRAPHDNAAQQWPLRRPRRAGLFVWGLVAAALACMAGVSLYTVPVAAYVLWRLRAHPQWGLVAARGVLHRNEDGEWGWSMNGLFQRLQLEHAWPCGAWLTLRFTRLPAPEAGGSLELTVWKACLSPDSWRRLCVLAARGQSRPDPAPRPARKAA